jgi:hypothetical protein
MPEPDVTTRGAAGDKVPVADPAAAPLGTDEEAAGSRATATAAEIAARDRRAMAAATVTPADENAGDAPGRQRLAVILGIAGVIVVIVLLGIVVGTV